MNRKRPGSTLFYPPRQDRIGAAMRHARGALRGIGWSRLGWATGIGAAGGLLFLVSHGMHRFQALWEHKAALATTLLEASIAVGSSIAVAILLLLAVSIAEYGDGGRPRGWARYAMAIVVAVACATAVVHGLPPRVPVDALVGWYGLAPGPPIDTFVFTNWLLFGGLAVLVYVRLRRARWIQAAFERAEIERVAASSRLARSRLATSQAQIEPGFLFDTLHQIEARYEHDAAGGERMIDDLIAYLRAALPQIRGEDSTLAREAALAEAFLRIVQDRAGSRLMFAFNIPPALGTRRFPPMLLLPLVEKCMRGHSEAFPHAGRLEILATAHSDRMRVTVTDTAARHAVPADDPVLATLRDRLSELSGGDATLTLEADHARGATAIVEVSLT
ncbi:MAG: histidine kinase [Burkholderiales bacterium]